MWVVYIHTVGNIYKKGLPIRVALNTIHTPSEAEQYEQLEFCQYIG